MKKEKKNKKKENKEKKIRISDKTILRASLAISITGIIILIILTQAKNEEIKRINKNPVIMSEGEKTTFKGIITRITKKKKTTIISIKGECETKAIIYDKEINDKEIREGDEIMVRGRIKEYNKEKNIIAEEIKKTTIKI